MAGKGRQAARVAGDSALSPRRGGARMVVKNVRADEGRALLEMLDALRQGAQGSSAITVRVLAAADHDGVCAAKIMATVLQRAGVKFTVVPVTGNSEVIEHMAQLEADAEVRSLVLLNCGASLDLQRQLEDCAAPPELRCFVVDAHRPLLLANLSSRHKRVVVLDDDFIAEAGGVQPPVSDDEPEEPEPDEDEADGDGDSDMDKENLWDPATGRAMAPEKSYTAERRAKRRKLEHDRQARLEKKRQRINEYYLTSYCATPATMSLFKMARQAAPPSQDMLWLAAVSLVGYHDQGLLDEVNYSRLLWEELKEALDSAVDFPLSQPSQASAPSTVGESFGSDGEASAPVRRRPPPRNMSGRRRLRFESDLRLVLYRHWNLEESMRHSGYFHGALELYRDQGLRALKEFFAKAGIPPADYRQIYSGMQLPIRKNLHKKYRDVGRAFGLTDKMFLEQFIRDLGPIGETSQAMLTHELSCADAVQVVTSLLSAIPQALSSTRLEHLPHTSDGRRDAVAIGEMERQAMVDNFWRAFDAVLCTEPSSLLEGIKEAAEVAREVEKLARYVKDKKLTRTTRRFQWCKIEDPRHFFRHHLTVRRLAVWLRQAVLRHRMEGLDRPLLVIVRDQVRDTYLCVGASFGEQDEFGNLFRSVLRADRSLKYRYDFFDKSVIEIAADDFDRFWELIERCAGMRGPRSG